MFAIISFNVVIFLLLLIGSIFVGNLNNFDQKFFKHIISVLLGLGVYVLISLGIIRVNGLVKYSPYIWLFSFFIIVINLFIGTEVNGSKAWIYVGNFSFQPAELSKLSLVLLLAWLINIVENRVLFFLICLGLAGLTALPIFLQPDLGFTILLFFSSLITSYLVGVNGLIILFFLSVSIFVGGLVMKPYQLERLITFLDPYRDPLGSGWQTIQSVNCVINGGLFGNGIGKGMISRLGFLPEKDTDFIFSVICEDMGLLGAIFIMFLFMILLFLMIWVYGFVRKMDEKVMVAFVFSVIFVQSFINIGMNTMSAPVTGLPLPLISYGGTNMVITLFLLGIVNEIMIRNLEFRKIEKWIY
ncbi:MAG: FtsW/RodA/SpoVE family cell cycle protein [bacterium]